MRTVGKFEKGRITRRKDSCSTITERHNAPRGNEQISKAEGENPVTVHLSVLQKLFREQIPGLPQDETVANQMAADDRQRIDLCFREDSEKQLVTRFGIS